MFDKLPKALLQFLTNWDLFKHSKNEAALLPLVAVVAQSSAKIVFDIISDSSDESISQR